MKKIKYLSVNKMRLSLAFSGELDTPLTLIATIEEDAQLPSR